MSRLDDIGGYTRHVPEAETELMRKLSDAGHRDCGHPAGHEGEHGPLEINLAPLRGRT
jgi:hypothetical protein